MSDNKRPGGWVDGIGWVCRQDWLPPGTEYGNRWHGPEDPLVMSPSKMRHANPIIVYRWADGTEPTP